MKEILYDILLVCSNIDKWLIKKQLLINEIKICLKKVGILLIKTRRISTLRKTFNNKNNNHRLLFMVLLKLFFWCYPTQDIFIIQSTIYRSWSLSRSRRKKPGAGQKRTSSATLIFDNHICIKLFLAAKSYFFLFSRERYTLVTLTFSNSRALYNLNSL